MKIEEAKEKLCPLAKVQYRQAHTRCIGDDCMAWRWIKNCVDGVNSITITIVSETDGYCGLAGKE
jgi:hypothetical protein